MLINGIQHLLVFPWINKTAGSETAGRMLACLSIIYIFATTYGISMNNVRLIEERKGNGSNGDYLLLIAFGCMLLPLINIVSKHFGFDPQVNLCWFTLLSVLTLIRSYGIVDFRLKLDFFSYFVFYFFISLGYAIGVYIYKLTDNWTLIFITGEILGVIYLYLRKFIFKLVKPTNQLASLGKALVLLYFSALMLQIIVSGDRLILKYMINDHVVTVYSSLSLAGKIMNMLLYPLGTVLLSYLTAKTIPLTKKWLLKVSSCWLLFGILAFIGTIIVSPIYVKIFYPNLYNDIQGLNIIVNIGLGLALIGFLFRIYLIASSNASVVFWFEVCCTAIHVVFAILLTKHYGMFGYAWAVIISRIFRIILGAILSTIYVNKCEKAAVMQTE